MRVLGVRGQMTDAITRRAFVVNLSASALALPLWSGKDGDGKPILTGTERKKKSLGQFFTEDSCWLQPQIAAFIEESGCAIAYDPFAGSGCLFAPVTNAIERIKTVVGLDIDESLGWKVNDSLLGIPFVQDAIIITNPPYLSNYSASRKRIGDDVRKYFDTTSYDDVYLLALDRMLSAQRHVVAIIPETFINSSYSQKSLLDSITVLEKNPFHDTDTPVVVVCFDSTPKSYERIKVFKNDQLLCSLADVENSRLKPKNNLSMRFNDINGWLGVRCVDTTDPNDMIQFDFREKIGYDWTRGIKNSSQLLTLISVDVPRDARQRFIDSCNDVLQDLRTRSYDLVLSPFKGNMKNGVRRRRLDFQTCRAIVEKAHLRVFGRTFQRPQTQMNLLPEAV